jgi:recombination protein RecA
MSRASAALRQELAGRLTVISATPRREVEPARRFVLTELTGRVVELSGLGDTATLTLAFSLVRQAQCEGETVAWLTPVARTFYPPDAARCGVDLAALVVVRCPEARAMAAAADKLARSGAFGLLVLDLDGDARVPLATLSRLAGLAKKHDAAVVCLTEKREEAASLGSLVGVHGRTRRQAAGAGFTVGLEAIKDKRWGPGWRHEVRCDGPPGLC